MRRKEIWKKRLYKAAALGMALSMLAGSPMAALAEGEISANEAEAGEDQLKVIEVIGGFNDPSQIGDLILIDDDDDGNGDFGFGVDDDDDDDDDVITGSFPVTVEEETIVETEVDDDGVIIATETTITRTETAYKTDAEQEGEFDYTTKEAVEGQTLDYTDTMHFEEAETHYYVADENGEIVTVTNENGEEVKLEIEEGAIAEAEEVWVGEGENGEIIELDADKAEEVVYGTIGEDGSFIELEEGTEGGQYYAPSEEGMVVAAIWYTAEDANGNTVTIDPEVMKALRGEESAYTVNRAYFLDGQEYTAEELADILPEGAEIGALDYDLDSNVFVEGTEITIPAGTKLQGAPAAIAGLTQFVYNGYVYNTRATILTRTPASGYGWEFAEDVVIKASDLQIIGKARYTDREGEKNFTATENQKNVIVTVYDEAGNVVWTGNKATYDKIKEHAVSVVAGKIAVEDITGETIYLDPGTYKEVRETTKYVYEYRDEYYTPHDKYTQKELTTTLNGKEYKLTVQFWDNNRIGLRNAILFPAFESDYMILQLVYDYADYPYSGFTYSYSRSKPLAKVLYPSDFGPNGEAVLTVKYTPEYAATEDFQELRFEVKAVGAKKANWEDEEEDDFFITDPSEAEEWDGVDSRRYFTDEAYRKRVDEYYEDMGEMSPYDGDPYVVNLDEVPVNSEYQYFRREVKLGKPYASLVKVGAENPAPNPNPNPSPAPVNNTVVTSTASAAAVLGESREQVVEETPEEAAVLGEDRPQTGDMAMPALWLLVMIGCGAGAALVLRKKEK